MGIKNPEPSMRETVQPVIVVGDMSEITPQYRPPTGYYGGDTAAFVAEWSFIEVVCRSGGGSLMGLTLASNVHWATTTPVAATYFDDPYPVAAVCSVEPPVSLVRTGHTGTIPFAANRSPVTLASQGVPIAVSRLLWLPPGGTMLFFRPVANTSIQDWSLLLIDLPAAENSIL